MCRSETLETYAHSERHAAKRYRIRGVPQGSMLGPLSLISSIKLSNKSAEYLFQSRCFEKANACFWQHMQIYISDI